MSKIEIVQLPQLKDNYIYLLISTQTKECAVIDCADGESAAEYLEKKGLKPTLALATHHHADHIGGFEYLKERFPSIRFGGYLGDERRLPPLELPLRDGEKLSFAGVTGTVLHVPGHTSGHLAYYFPQLGALFCGDVLFAGGCGRIFEGTPQQMFESLQKLAQLPPDTKVYCGHEYTESNLKFALTVEPDNRELKEFYQKVIELRKEGLPTVPTTLELEKKINPFLRVGEPAVRQKALENGANDDPISIFAKIRELKNRF